MRRAVAVAALAALALAVPAQAAFMPSFTREAFEPGMPHTFSFPALAPGQMLVFGYDQGRFVTLVAPLPTGTDWCQTNSDLNPAAAPAFSCTGQNGGGTGVPNRILLAGAISALGYKGYVNTTIEYAAGSIRFDCLFNAGDALVGVTTTGTATCGPVNSSGTIPPNGAWVLKGTQTRSIFGAVQHIVT